MTEPKFVSTTAVTQSVHLCPVVSGGVTIHREDCSQVPPHTHRASARPTAQTLLAAMNEVWPTHIEGTGGTGGVREQSWNVMDPTLPNIRLARDLCAALDRAAAGEARIPTHDSNGGDRG